ncbi:hypothetical protein GCM10022221_71180 [Actinocorallia aurea]
MTGDAGPAREALRLLDRATAVARHEPCPKLHALIEMRKAPAAALLGDEAAVRRLIGVARGALDRPPQDRDPSTVAFVTPAESFTGHCDALSASLRSA